MRRKRCRGCGSSSPGDRRRRADGRPDGTHLRRIPAAPTDALHARRSCSSARTFCSIWIRSQRNSACSSVAMASLLSPPDPPRPPRRTRCGFVARRPTHPAPPSGCCTRFHPGHHQPTSQAQRPELTPVHALVRRRTQDAQHLRRLFHRHCPTIHHDLPGLTNPGEDRRYASYARGAVGSVGEVRKNLLTGVWVRLTTPEPDPDPVDLAGPTSSTGDHRAGHATWPDSGWNSARSPAICSGRLVRWSS